MLETDVQLPEVEDAPQGADNDSTQPENTAPKYLTVDDLDYVLDAKLEAFARKSAEASTRAFRATQSMIDKGRNNALNEAKAFAAQLRAEGVPLDDKAEEIIQKRALDRYMETLGTEQPEPARERDSATEQPPQDRYISGRMNRITTKNSGVQILPTDPEAGKVDEAWKKSQKSGDMEDFFEVYEQQLAVKVRRMGTPSAARVGLGGGANQVRGKDALAAELQTLLKDPTKNILRIREVKAELQK